MIKIAGIVTKSLRIQTTLLFENLFEHSNIVTACKQQDYEIGFLDFIFQVIFITFSYVLSKFRYKFYVEN